MVGHEIFGLLGTIVAGTIILASFKPGSQSAQVLTAVFNGFGGLLSVMQGNNPGSTTSPQG